MEHVRFKGDVRLVTARAIEAVTGELPSVDEITSPCDTRVWRGKLVRFFCTDEGNGVYSLLHPAWIPAPFINKYSNAMSLVDGLVEVIEVLTREEWNATCKTK